MFSVKTDNISCVNPTHILSAGRLSGSRGLDVITRTERSWLPIIESRDSGTGSVKSIYSGH